jgi:hypothetical protein
MDLVGIDRSSEGQAMEFAIWMELIRQSRGALHIFLPLLDQGLDAVVHRLTDGKYIPVQVKARSELNGPSLQLFLPATKFVDDHAVMVAGLLTDDQLGPNLLVVEEGTFKQLAVRYIDAGEEVYTADINLDSPRPEWSPYVIPRDRLAERFLEGQWATATFELAPKDRHRSWLGFLGESEVIRRVAENPQLDLFRPFPDLELVEILVRDNVTIRFCGLQVKTSSTARWDEASIHIRKSTFVTMPGTYVVALAWLAETKAFADECILIPTQDVPEVTYVDGEDLVFEFQPHSSRKARIDPYRVPLAELGELVGRTTSG